MRRTGTIALAGVVLFGMIAVGFVCPLPVTALRGLALAAGMSCGIFLSMVYALSLWPTFHHVAASPHTGVRWSALVLPPMPIHDRWQTSMHGDDAHARLDRDDSPAAPTPQREAGRSDREIIAALHSFAQNLGGPISLDLLLRDALQIAARYTGSNHGTVLLLDDSGEQIRYRVALDSDNIAPLELIAKPMMSRGLAGWVARERRAVRIADTEQDPRWLTGPGQGDLRSAIVAPLLHGEQVLGLITLAHEAPGHYTDEQLHVLEILGAQVALAVENARLAATPRPAPPALPTANGYAALVQPHAGEAAVVAVELRGLAAAGSRLTPEVMIGDVLNDYFQAMLAIVDHHHGVVERLVGDTLLAIFGHPDRCADDTTRAVRAALEMQRAAGELRARWRARLGLLVGGLDIGIACGQVVIGRLGTAPHTYDMALGEAVNSAVRLRDLARAGEILAAAEVAAAINDSGEPLVVEALQPLQVRGAAPQYIYRIGEPHALHAPPNRLGNLKREM
jgi:class 3 adenylate cyclase